VRVQEVARGRTQRARAKVGRPSGAFTQRRRYDQIRTLLENAPRGLTLYELAATLRITPRSVRRYLGELDRLTQLECVATEPGGANLWRIKPSERGRSVALRRAQAYAILAARGPLEILRGSALHDEIDLALGQIAKIAQTPFRTSGKTEISGERRLEDRFFVLPPTARSYAPRGEDVDELFRAVADLRVLRYRPRGNPRGERVAFHAYAMVVHKGTILVLGSRTLGRDVDVVPLDAMTEVRSSETEHFELPEELDLAQYVHGEFGVARPARGRFVVEFDARVADEIRARRVHPQQKIYTAPDGRVRLSAPYVGREAVLPWILSWGDAAHVVEPPELARDAGEVLERAARRYR
jgi:predicted DNA-binding transcriptional regulator YafY